MHDKTMDNHEQRGYQDGVVAGRCDRQRGDSPAQMRQKLATYRRHNGQGAWMRGWYAGYAVGVGIDGDDAEAAKPTCVLTSRSGDAVAIIGRVSDCLIRAGELERATAFRERAFAQSSDDALLRLVSEYVEVA